LPFHSWFVNDKLTGIVDTKSKEIASQGILRKQSPTTLQNLTMARVLIDLPQSFQFLTEIPVRITDINYGGHLGNDAVLALFQEARVQMLKQYGWSEMDIEGSGVIMSDAAVVYKSEAFYGEILTIEIAVIEITRAGCDFVYRMTNRASGKEVARAKTGIVFFDYASRRIVGVPEQFKRKFGHPLEVE
jgi:acyl-CoA thioester hydrolase